MEVESDAASVRITLDGTSMSTFVLCMLIVPLKIVCRVYIAKGSLGWDDYRAMLSMLLANALFYMQLVGIRPMLWHNIWEYELPELIKFLKYVYALQIIYTASICMIQASLLCFYWRLLSVRSRTPLLVAAGIIVSWVVTTSLLLGLTCMPVEAQWNLDIPYDQVRCLDRKSVYVGASCGNVVMDILLLVLPIPYVWNLHARQGQRLILIGMFLLGIFVTIVSIVRLSIFATLDLSDLNVTSTLSEVFIWSGVEMPSLRPVVQFLGLRRMFGSSHEHSSQAGGWVAPLPSYRGVELDLAQEMKRKQGLLSTLALQTDDEEEGSQMIDDQNDSRRKTNSAIEVVHESSDAPDTERHLTLRETTAMPAIEVKRQIGMRSGKDNWKGNG